MMFVKKITLATVTMLILSACAVDTVDDGKIQVVTTVGMVADAVQNIGGEFVNVESLMGPGVDPHLYKASAGDIGKMENADIVFYVGLHLEGKMVEVFESLAEKKTVVAVAENISESELLGAQAGQTGNYDPHIWFDVALWSSTIGEIEKTLSEKDPANSGTYKANAAAYLEELTELDIWVTEQALLVPESQRLMVTAHDAFNYFGEAYGFDVRGIQGISTASDYGLKDLEEIIDLIVERQVKAVFVESSVPKKSIEALVEGVKAEGHEIVIGGQLFSDAMGDAGTPEGTYIGMVKHNVNTIVNALK